MKPAMVVGASRSVRRTVASKRCVPHSFSCPRKLHAAPRRLAGAPAASVLKGPEQSISDAADGEASFTSTTGSASEAAEFKIDWRNQWYPVIPVDVLPKDRPRAFTVLGKKLVVWSPDAGKTWSVLEDKCPHRKVNLSEGRVEDGELMCAYHGWTFNGDGSCASIPQIPDKQRSEKIRSSPSACAPSFPATVGSGLLWVWMTPGGDAHLKAMGTPLPRSADDVTDNDYVEPWMWRDMPMAWEIQAENLNDPDHVPHSHHGFIGNRYASVFNRFSTVDMVGPDGFRVAAAGQQGVMVTRDGESPMQAPTQIELHYRKIPSTSDMRFYDEAGGENFRLNFAIVPITRNTCRILFRRVLPNIPPLGKFWLQLRPLWYLHLDGHVIPDGDGVFLQRQAEDTMSGRLNPLTDYFTPAQGDLGVNAFWRFLDRYTHGEPAGSADYYPDAGDLGAPGPLSKEQVLDRYEAHTKDCPYCMAALENVRRGAALTQVIATAALAAGMGVVACGNTLMAAAPLLALSAVCAAGHVGLKTLEARFLYVGYVHADHH